MAGLAVAGPSHSRRGRAHRGRVVLVLPMGGPSPRSPLPVAGGGRRTARRQRSVRSPSSSSLFSPTGQDGAPPARDRCRWGDAGEATPAPPAPGAARRTMEMREEGNGAAHPHPNPSGDGAPLNPSTGDGAAPRHPSNVGGAAFGCHLRRRARPGCRGRGGSWRSFISDALFLESGAGRRRPAGGGAPPARRCRGGESCAALGFNFFFKEFM
jgi:hypothetical protein